MKKILLSLLAVLLLAGTVYAASIPLAVDPKNHREIWTTEVYNNTTSAMTSGTVVVWGFAASTGDYADQCNWVTLPGTASANNVWTAGVVVSDSIPSYSEGSICIRGVVPVKTREDWTVDDIVGSSSTYDGFASEAAVDGGTNNDQCYLGVAVNAEDVVNTVTVTEYVFVNPSIDFDND